MNIQVNQAIYSQLKGETEKRVVKLKKSIYNTLYRDVSVHNHICKEVTSFKTMSHLKNH